MTPCGPAILFQITLDYRLWKMASRRFSVERARGRCLFLAGVSWHGMCKGTHRVGPRPGSRGPGMEQKANRKEAV